MYRSLVPRELGLLSAASFSAFGDIPLSVEILVHDGLKYRLINQGETGGIITGIFELVLSVFMPEIHDDAFEMVLYAVRAANPTMVTLCVMQGCEGLGEQFMAALNTMRSVRAFYVVRYAYEDEFLRGTMKDRVLGIMTEEEDADDANKLRSIAVPEHVVDAPWFRMVNGIPVPFSVEDPPTGAERRDDYDDVVLFTDARMVGYAPIVRARAPGGPFVGGIYGSGQRASVLRLTEDAPAPRERSVTTTPFERRQVGYIRGANVREESANVVFRNLHSDAAECDIGAIVRGSPDTQLLCIVGADVAVSGSPDATASSLGVLCLWECRPSWFARDDGTTLGGDDDATLDDFADALASYDIHTLFARGMEFPVPDTVSTLHLRGAVDMLPVGLSGEEVRSLSLDYDHLRGLMAIYRETGSESLPLLSRLERIHVVVRTPLDAVDLDLVRFLALHMGETLEFLGVEGDGGERFAYALAAALTGDLGRLSLLWISSRNVAVGEHEAGIMSRFPLCLLPMRRATAGAFEALDAVNARCHVWFADGAYPNGQPRDRRRRHRRRRGPRRGPRPEPVPQSSAPAA